MTPRPAQLRWTPPDGPLLLVPDDGATVLPGDLFIIEAHGRPREWIVTQMRGFDSISGYVTEYYLKTTVGPVLTAVATVAK